MPSLLIVRRSISYGHCRSVGGKFFSLSDTARTLFPGWPSEAVPAVAVASAVPTGRNLRSLRRQRSRQSIERRSLRTARTKWRPAQPPCPRRRRCITAVAARYLAGYANSHTSCSTRDDHDRAFERQRWNGQQHDRQNCYRCSPQAIIHFIPTVDTRTIVLTHVYLGPPFNLQSPCHHVVEIRFAHEF